MFRKKCKKPAATVAARNRQCLNDDYFYLNNNHFSSRTLVCLTTESKMWFPTRDY